jgi:glycosyltransferase involved in cell wall biosynthesis
MDGFDTHFSPAYYEDTDLAFRMRARGLRVLYQPAAEVYHLEGVSHGTDTNTGVKAYKQINAVKFFERWKDVLMNHRPNAEHPELEAHRSRSNNVLIVEACMITPDQDSGSIRMLNLLSMLLHEGHHVTFVADNLEYREKYVEQLTQMGVEVFHGEWAESVPNLLKRIGKQLNTIFFCRHYIASQYIDNVRRYAPNARIVFDTVDLHFVREDREAKLHNNNAMLRASEQTRKQELAIIAKSDVTVVVSEFEKKLLADLMPTACVEIISNIHSNSPARPDYSAREGIIFVGGFRHPPNTDAITWYADEVLPHLRRFLPGVKTRVIGSNMPACLASIANEDLELLGFIENIEPYLQRARISIAPLRYGAGVKGKVNEAMNYGIPVVATACAVEGMYLQAGLEVMVAEDAQSFAEAVAKVYCDEVLWQQLSQAGVDNVSRHFSPSAALPALRRVLLKQ